MASNTTQQSDLTTLSTPEVSVHSPTTEKRVRPETETETESENENGVVSKKQKVEELKEVVGPVGLGPKTFVTSLEMFNYFYKFLHHWPLNIPVNKYENMVLQDLIKKGHPEPEKKIGSGISAFEIRYHPKWQNRCIFVVRDDKSAEDFSFRKCVDQILPLPENMKLKPDSNDNGKNGGGGRGGRGGGHGRGGGRRGGGRFRR
ncbi:hypothetical protein vseg_013830 [Gypsophila vaccaria]